MAGREDPVELCISQMFRRSPCGGGSGELAIAPVRDPHAEGGPGYPAPSQLGNGGQLLVRCLAGAARLRDYSVGAQRSAQRGWKSRVERKGKSRLEPDSQHESGARKRGLAILGRLENGGRGVGKVTAGITGLWPLRAHIDAAF